VQIAPAMPKPTYSPDRDFSLRSEGADIGHVAAALGKPLMPWQQHVADIATEILPDGSYKYPLVLITVPRQSGKTTLVGPWQINRLMHNPGRKAFYTAQTGKDARARFADLVSLVQESPIEELFTMRYAAGSESMNLPNRSSLNIFAPGPSALHGETPPLVTLDEIWKHDEIRGNELMGAIGPAQITIKNRQIVLISTMGTAQSVFMNKLIERGRAGEPGFAYFEWSMPEGMDPYDPDTWAAFHPAYGITIDQTGMAIEANRYVDNPGEWMRAYMNRRTEAEDPIIGTEDFKLLANLGPADAPLRREVAISYEVGWNNACAAVVASWRDAAGMPCNAIVHAAPGTAWLAPFIRMISATWKPAVIAADDGGATRRITDELQNPTSKDLAPLEVYTIGPRDHGTACDAWLTWARDDKLLRWDGSRSLSTAVANAVLRKMSGGITFSREHSTAPIPSLIASAVGLWAYDHREETLGKPLTEW
jgi:hypothetical protein